MKISFVLLMAAIVSSSTLAQEKSSEFYDMPYDTTADPFVQLENAKSLASKENKLILLDVGGKWCVWCHRLDDLFREHTDLATYLKAHYVPVKINYSLENKNEKFLAQYPAIDGYPHIFVLDAAGNLVHSQNTGDLEEGKGHSPDKVMTFLKKWAELKNAGT